MAPYPDYPDQDSSPTTTFDHHEKAAAPTVMVYTASNPFGGPPTPIYVVDVHGNTIVIFVDQQGKQHTFTTITGTPFGQEEATLSSSATSTITPYAKTKASTTPINTSNPTSSMVQDGSQTSTNFPAAQQDRDHHHPPFPAVAALGIIIPTILIMVSLCGFFFCIRPRWKRATQAAGTAAESAHARRVPEMKHLAVSGGPQEHSQRAVGGPSTVSTGVGASIVSPTSTSSASTATPPVILSTTMNNTYYTGIDTSDRISLNDQQSEASADTFGDEPPPPYRPRSVPPISREASVRNSVCRNTSVRSSLIGVRRSADVRSPFDDPEDSDEDNISQISTIRSHPRHDTDRLSVVSDLSYQEEPTVTHSIV